MNSTYLFVYCLGVRFYFDQDSKNKETKDN